MTAPAAWSRARKGRKAFEMGDNRNMLSIALLAALSFSFAFAIGVINQEAYAADPVMSSVGMMRLDYADDARPSWRDPGEARPVGAWAWYPARRPAEAQDFSVPEKRPVFVGGYAVLDAPPREGARPLVVLSHGTGGSAFQMMWLGRRLAEAGYIAVAVDHHGNSAAEPQFDPRGFFYVWERPRDLAVLIDSITSDPRFASSIDEDRIAAAGFSLGGYTALAVVGGRIDLDRFRKFCASAEADATCDPQTEYADAAKDLDALIAADPGAAPDETARRASYRDPRIKAVAAFAPALGQMLSDESLAAIETPVAIAVGDADKVAPESSNARRIADHVPDARFERYSGIGHYAFLNTCTKHGRRYVAVCKDAQGVDREAVHDRAAAYAIGHFEDVFSAAVE